METLIALMHESSNDEAYEANILEVLFVLFGAHTVDEVSCENIFFSVSFSHAFRFLDVLVFLSCLMRLSFSPPFSLFSFTLRFPSFFFVMVPSKQSFPHWTFIFT